MSLNTIEHNIPINISCISTNARPPPEVTWTLRGEEVRDNNLLFTMHDESNTFTTSIFIMSYRPKVG
uniref:CD80-like immunoglobulin C2-set domain-containing protein n=2 Tax=Lepeophtheirus salmonis TaxID=72036 RepID=A0A0K2TEV2_LEPSM